MRIGVLTTSYPRDSRDLAGRFVSGMARWGFVADHLREGMLRAVRVRRLRARLAERSMVCAMGVDAPARIGRAEARRRLAIAADARVVAFVGRLVPIKGIDVLVDAV